MTTTTPSAPPAQPGLLRSLNNRTVLRLLTERGTLSRGDVRDLTGLSKPTASQLLTRLEDAGLVESAGFGDTGPGGRAPQLYRIVGAAGHAAAIDARPGAIHARVADITGKVVGSATTTPRGDAVADTIEALEAACAASGITTTNLNAVVIGAPGSFDTTTDQVRYADHLVGWQNPGITAAIGERLPGAIVAIENDVNLVAIAELHRAATANATLTPGGVVDTSADDFFLLWLDERVGGALVIGGTIYRGHRGAAGEAAFLLPSGVMPDDTTKASGGFEQLVGEDALSALATSAVADAAPARSASSAAASAMAAVAADPALLPQLARRYAVGIASVIALLDPARIVLAGELTVVGGEQLRAAIAVELGDLVIAAPPVVLSADPGEPILDGALILSLEHARASVFST